MDFLSRLQAVEKKIKENQLLKAKLEEKRDNLETEYKRLLNELEALNIKEEDLAQTITNLETEIEEEILTVEEALK